MCKSCQSLHVHTIRNCAALKVFEPHFPTVIRTCHAHSQHIDKPTSSYSNKHDDITAFMESACISLQRRNARPMFVATLVAQGTYLAVQTVEMSQFCRYRGEIDCHLSQATKVSEFRQSTSIHCEFNIVSFTFEFHMILYLLKMIETLVTYGFTQQLHRCLGLSQAAQSHTHDGQCVEEIHPLVESVS